MSPQTVMAIITAFWAILLVGWAVTGAWPGVLLAALVLFFSTVAFILGRASQA